MEYGCCRAVRNGSSIDAARHLVKSLPAGPPPPTKPFSFPPRSPAPIGDPHDHHHPPLAHRTARNAAAGRAVGGGESVADDGLCHRRGVRRAAGGRGAGGGQPVGQSVRADGVECLGDVRGGHRADRRRAGAWAPCLAGNTTLGADGVVAGGGAGTGEHGGVPAGRGDPAGRWRARAHRGAGGDVPDGAAGGGDPDDCRQCAARFRGGDGASGVCHGDHRAGDRRQCAGQLRLCLRALGDARHGPERVGAVQRLHRAGHAGRLFAGHPHRSPVAPIPFAGPLVARGMGAAGGAGAAGRADRLPCWPRLACSAGPPF